MFFILSRLINFLLSPLLWIVVAFLYGLLAKSQKRKKWMLWIAFCLLIIFTNPFLGNYILRIWEIPYKQDSEIKKTFDYGIVLGGISSWDKDYKRLISRASSDRLIQTLDLYKSGKIKKIIILGGSRSITKLEERESSYLKEYLLRIGILEQDIIIDPQSRNTEENAEFIANQPEIKNADCILITSALHMRRAEKCFQKKGIKIFTWPTDRISLDTNDQLNIANIIIPSEKYLSYWRLILKEVVGYEVYRIMEYF